MAKTIICLKNKNSGHERRAPFGFSWTMLFFPFFTTLFRKDWKASFVIYMISGILFYLNITHFEFIFCLSIFIAAIYNELYLRKLLISGYEVTSIVNGNKDEIEKAINLSLPLYYSLDEKESEFTTSSWINNYIAIPSKWKIALRKKYTYELVWRLFLAMQTIGFLFVFYLSIITVEKNWSLFPELDLHSFYWSLLDSDYWVDDKHNWIALLCFCGPYLLTRTIDWILSAKPTD